MQTRSLRTLARISQLGSFARVADEMNMTLSAVSMQMKALEDGLGVALFDRAYRPPKLTPLGRTIAEHAERVTLAQSRLLNACSEAGELAGTFKLGFIASASVRLLPQLLSNASNGAPKVKFELETGLSQALEARVLSGVLDAAVVTASEKPPSGLRYDVLRSERLCFAVPGQHTSLTLDELIERVPFLQFNPSSGIGKLIESNMREVSGGRIKEPIVLDGVEAIMECVNQGLGFTLLSEPDIERYAIDSVDLKMPVDKNLARQLVLASVENGLVGQDVEKLVKLFG